MSDCPDREELARVLAPLASEEPVVAGAILGSIHREDDVDLAPWESADAAEAGDVEYGPANDDDPDEDDDEFEFRWWVPFALPYAKALGDTICTHRAWARSEFGLDPELALVTTPDLDSLVRVMLAKWLVGMEQGKTPKLSRISHRPGHRHIDELLGAQLRIAGQAWPISPSTEAFECLERFLAEHGDSEARRKAEARPHGRDFRNYHALGACVCWFLVDRYAEAWNRSWHLGRFELN